MKKLLITILILFSTSALACPLLEHGNPKVGSTVSAGIDKLELEFSSKIYPEQSTITVTDVNGNNVNTGKAYGKSGDDNFIATKLSPLAAGTYKVTWDVFCDCGHLNPGDYKFTVK